MLKIMRTEKEIDEVLNRCDALSESGENPWPGETYSGGVKHAIMWLTGQHNDNPMTD